MVDDLKIMLTDYLHQLFMKIREKYKKNLEHGANLHFLSKSEKQLRPLISSIINFYNETKTPQCRNRKLT